MDYSSMVESLNKMLEAATDERERVQACVKSKADREEPQAETDDAQAMAQLPGSQVWVYEGHTRLAAASTYAVRGHGR